MAVVIKGEYSQSDLLLNRTSGLYEIGDLSGGTNSNKLSVDDANNLITAKKGTNVYLSLNTNGNVFQIGDITAASPGNNTFIKIDDANRRYRFDSGTVIAMDLDITGVSYSFGRVDLGTPMIYIDDSATKRINLNAASGVKITGDTVLLHTGTTLTNSAGASAGTLTNAPAVGNPTKWINIDDNGTTRKIPTWP